MFTLHVSAANFDAVPQMLFLDTGSILDGNIVPTGFTGEQGTLSFLSDLCGLRERQGPLNFVQTLYRLGNLLSN